MFVTIFQVSNVDERGKECKLVKYKLKTFFHNRVGVISGCTAKHDDATTVFTYPHVNTSQPIRECVLSKLLYKIEFD